MFTMMVMDVQFQFCLVKSLAVITAALSTRKKLNILQTDNFSWTHQRIQVIGLTGTTKSGETDK